MRLRSLRKSPLPVDDPFPEEVASAVLDGLPLQTGDLICTSDGGGEVLVGQFWRLLGRLVPGQVDHIVVYVGPGGRCVESAALGVIIFEFPDARWDAQAMRSQRGGLIDTLVGVAYPLAERGLSPEQEQAVRLAVARFCLQQALQRKPYNLNFLDSLTDHAFYCSQLAYCAYLPHGIDLNTGLGVPNLKGSERIVYPQEIWEGCAHREVGQF